MAPESNQFDFEPLDGVRRQVSDEHALPFYDITSSQPLPHFPDDLPVPPQPEKVWLDGDVLMCACPDCRAPMSIRLWLMLADCWNCGTSIELSEQMERDARRLMKERERNHRQQPAPRTPPPARPSSDPRPTPAEHRPARETQPQRPTSRPAAASNAVQRRRERMASAKTASVWVRDLFRQTPAWLVSLVLHLVALTILALLTMSGDDDEHITLSVAISRYPKEGGPETKETKLDDFDLIIPPTVNMQDADQREDVNQAIKDAKELLLDPKAPDPNLPDLTQARQQIINSNKSNNSLALRDPRFRVEIVRREGGTVMTEAAVARGLRWLARHQNANGSWALGRCRIRGCNCRHPGSFDNDITGTALALLPFLGAGQSHLVGRYKSTVSRGLRFIIQNQKDDGDLRGGSKTREGMYGHGQASIVLCEAYALTGDEVLRQPAQRAINFIVKAQYPGGGWRYWPEHEVARRGGRRRGDTSVLGWQLMALQSARSAKLKVPASTFELAGQYLDTVQSRSRSGGVFYSYMAGQTPDHVMTAEALLCRLYLDWKRNTPGLGKTVGFLNKNFPANSNYSNFYYMYYCTQLMRHMGGVEWRKWNVGMSEVLVRTQSKRGHEAGSWTPRRGNDVAGGRLYATSLAVCTLEVYYRFLPVFDPRRVLGEK